MDTLNQMFVEIRAVDADTREIQGTALTYGETAKLPFGNERFEAGAFGNLSRADVVLNLQHDRGRPLARTGGGGLSFSDDKDALTLRAKLPKTRDGDDALELVRSKILRGFSVEFWPKKERFEGTMDDPKRIVVEAELRGVALVDKPAYRGSKVQMQKRFLEHDPDSGARTYKTII